MTIPDEAERGRDLPDRGGDRLVELRFATTFVDYVTGSQGEATLKQYGFGPPPSRASAMRRRLPLAFVVLGAIGAAFVALPVLGLALRAPWGRIVEILDRTGREYRAPALARGLAVGTSVLGRVRRAARVDPRARDVPRPAPSCGRW